MKRSVKMMATNDSNQNLSGEPRKKARKNARNKKFERRPDVQTTEEVTIASTIQTLEEEDHITKLSKPSVKFPKAQFICNYCSYHIDTVEKALVHITQDRHKTRRKEEDDRQFLMNIPEPCEAHQLAMDRFFNELDIESFLIEPNEKHKRQNFVQKIVEYLQEKVPDVKLSVYGSLVNNLSISTSDVNIGLQIKAPQSNSSLNTQSNSKNAAHEANSRIGRHLQVIHQHLEEKKMFDKITRLLFPQPYLLCEKNGVNYKIGIFSSADLCRSVLINLYSAIDPRCYKLMVLLRQYAQMAHIDDPIKGTFSGSIFPILVIFYLQHLEVPILPNLTYIANKYKKLLPKKAITKIQVENRNLSHLSDLTYLPKFFKVGKNTSSLATLWREFFYFYLYKFKKSDYAVSITELEPVKKIKKQWGTKRLSIEDPFNFVRNMCRSVTPSENFDYITDQLSASYRYFSVPRVKNGSNDGRPVFTDLRIVRNSTDPKLVRLSLPIFETANQYAQGVKLVVDAVQSDIKELLSISNDIECDLSVLEINPKDRATIIQTIVKRTWSHILSDSNLNDLLLGINMNDLNLVLMPHVSNFIQLAEKYSEEIFVHLFNNFFKKDATSLELKSAKRIADRTLRRLNQSIISEIQKEGKSSISKEGSQKSGPPPLPMCTSETIDQKNEFDIDEEGKRALTSTPNKEKVSNEMNNFLQQPVGDVIQCEDKDSTSTGPAESHIEKALENNLEQKNDAEEAVHLETTKACDPNDETKDVTEHISVSIKTVQENHLDDSQICETNSKNENDEMDDEEELEEGLNEFSKIDVEDDNCQLEYQPQIVVEFDEDESQQNIDLNASAVETANSEKERLLIEGFVHEEETPEWHSNWRSSLAKKTDSLRLVEDEQPGYYNEKLLSGLTAENFLITFSPVMLAHRDPPELRCGSCQKLGHSKEECREDEPDLRQMPVSQPNEFHMKQMTLILTRLVTEEIEMDRRLRPSRQNAFQDIKTAVLKEFPKANLQLFGSCANGFGSSSSDLDVCLEFPNSQMPTSEDEKIKVIRKVTKCLHRSGRFHSIQPIPQAKVPIVKFCHKFTNLEGDVSINNLLALQNTRMLYHYSQFHQMVPYLGIAIKAVAKICGIGDASRGSLSSYAYVLLVIHYLQAKGYLPVLQEVNRDNQKELIIDGWNAWYQDDPKIIFKHWDNKKLMNPESLAHLWLGFFRYYLYEFDRENQVVAIRQSAPLNKIDKLWMSNLAIEDPFDLTHNLAGSLSRKMSFFILKVFHKIALHHSADHSKFPPQFLPQILFDPQVLTNNTEPPKDRGCRNCGKIGHLVRDCPNPVKSDVPNDAGRNRQNSQSERKQSTSSEVSNGNSRRSTASSLSETAPPPTQPIPIQMLMQQTISPPATSNASPQMPSSSPRSLEAMMKKMPPRMQQTTISPPATSNASPQVPSSSALSLETMMKKMPPPMAPPNIPPLTLPNGQQINLVPMSHPGANSQLHSYLLTCYHQQYLQTMQQQKANQPPPPPPSGPPPQQYTMQNIQPVVVQVNPNTELVLPMPTVQNTNDESALQTLISSEYNMAPRLSLQNLQQQLNPMSVPSNYPGGMSMSQAHHTSPPIPSGASFFPQSYPINSNAAPLAKDPPKQPQQSPMPDLNVNKAAGGSQPRSDEQKQFQELLSKMEISANQSSGKPAASTNNASQFEKTNYNPPINQQNQCNQPRSKSGNKNPPPAAATVGNIGRPRQQGGQSNPGGGDRSWYYAETADPNQDSQKQNSRSIRQNRSNGPQNSGYRKNNFNNGSQKRS